MSSNFALLNPGQHGQVTFDPSANGAECHKTRQMTLVFAAEFPSIAASLPIVFVKTPETGEFRAVALFSLQSGKNVMVRDNQWQSLSLPLVIRTFPFMLMPTDKEHSNFTVGADMDAPAFNSGNGERLFNDEGAPAETLNKVAEMLKSVVEYEHQTRAFINALVEQDLLVAKSLNARIDGDTPTKVDGFYVIDEQKLRELPAEVAQKWLANGFMHIIYAQIQSQHQVMNLIKHHQLHTA